MLQFKFQGVGLLPALVVPGEGLTTVNAKTPSVAQKRAAQKGNSIATVWWCSPQSCEMWTLKKKHRIYIYIYIWYMNLYTSIISLKHWILFWIVGFLLVAAINWRIWCITTQYWIMKKSELLLNFFLALNWCRSATTSAWFCVAIVFFRRNCGSTHWRLIAWIMWRWQKQSTTPLFFEIRPAQLQQKNQQTNCAAPHSGWEQP